MKKSILYMICIISSLLLLCGCSYSERFTIEGRYLKAKDSHIIIDSYGSPIVMKNENNNENLSDALETGDKIKITCSEILESYPAQCYVYSCKLIEKGSLDDIPEDTLKELKSLGWIE